MKRGGGVENFCKWLLKVGGGTYATRVGSTTRTLRETRLEDLTRSRAWRTQPFGRRNPYNSESPSGPQEFPSWSRLTGDTREEGSNRCRIPTGFQGSDSVSLSNRVMTSVVSPSTVPGYLFKFYTFPFFFSIRGFMFFF